MADDKKVSELTTATTPLSGSEWVDILQEGVNKKTQLSNVLAVPHSQAAGSISGLGTAAVLDVPATAAAAASSSQVVRGDDPRLGASGVYVNRGNVSGAVVIDMVSARDVVHRMVLVDDTTISATNVPNNTYTSLVLWVVQDATGGHTLTLPGGVTRLYGDTEGIDPSANAISIVILTTTNGGSTWLATFADVRPPDLESFYYSVPGNGDYEIIFTSDRTLALNQAVKSQGTIAFSKKPSGGSWASATGVATFAAGDMMRLTVTGATGATAITIPRVA